MLSVKVLSPPTDSSPVLWTQEEVSPPPPEMVMFPLPKSDSLFIVLMFVPETKTSCAPTSLAVYVGLLAAFAHAGTVGSVSVVNVPVFLVNPQADTVDSVTAEGIVAVIDATPLVTVASVPLKETPVKVPVLLVLLFQLVISPEVIPYAADAVNTGSVSVVIPLPLPPETL